MRGPYTRYLGEIVQTTKKKGITANNIDQFAHVFHHDVVADDLSPFYIQGMVDCYGIRFKYSYEDNM